MLLAGVPDEDRPLLYRVALRTICGAHIDAVLVVEAPADRVPFDDEVAHLDCAWWRASWRGERPMPKSERRSGVGGGGYKKIDGQEKRADRSQ